MKQDVLLKQDDVGLFDLKVVDQDFESVSGFETSIIVSLFTDERAPSSAVFSAQRRRGWIGDILTSDIGRSLGSLLWLYEQSRITTEILNEIKIAAQDSLDWMIEDRIAREVSVDVTQDTKRDIVINIEILTLQGESQRYSVLWRRTDAVNI